MGYLKPLFRLLAGAILLPGLPVSAQAEDQSEPFPGYDNACGYRIVVTPTSSVSQAVVRPDGTRVILLDPRLDSGIERFRRIFLIAHECAHHRMGHADPASRRGRAICERALETGLLHLHSFPVAV